jgi:hypothetical protein
MKKKNLKPIKGYVIVQCKICGNEIYSMSGMMYNHLQLHKESCDALDSILFKYLKIKKKVKP